MAAEAESRRRAELGRGGAFRIVVRANGGSRLGQQFLAAMPSTIALLDSPDA